jgi:hypothetical protein
MALLCCTEWADPPFEESYQMTKRFILSELIMNGNRPENLILTAEELNK